MAAANGNSAALEERELVITRTFNAPRELVWKMFTDMNHMRQWMGPREYPASPRRQDRIQACARSLSIPRTQKRKTPMQFPAIYKAGAPMNRPPSPEHLAAMGRLGG